MQREPWGPLWIDIFFEKKTLFLDSKHGRDELNRDDLQGWLLCVNAAKCAHKCKGSAYFLSLGHDLLRMNMAWMTVLKLWSSILQGLVSFLGRREVFLLWKSFGDLVMVQMMTVYSCRGDVS